MSRMDGKKNQETDFSPRKKSAQTMEKRNRKRNGHQPSRNQKRNRRTTDCVETSKHISEGGGSVSSAGIKAEDNIGLVYKFLAENKHKGWLQNIEWEEAIQIAMLGLLKGIKTFVKTKGNLSSHCWTYMHGEFWWHIQNEGLVRWEIKKQEGGYERKPGVRIARESDSGAALEAGIEIKTAYEENERVKKIIEIAAEGNEKKTAALFGWLVENKTVVELAEELEVTSQRIHAIKREAIEKWREAAKADDEKGRVIMELLAKEK